LPDNKDIKKAARQHLEMEEFFSGGLTVKGKKIPQAPAVEQEHSAPPRHNTACNAAEKAAKLEEQAVIIRKCRKCDLGSSRTNAVPGDGNPAARIVFIGEAPGADEDAQGLPFVGRAGQLLNKIIEAMGLKRSEVYIGNVLKCRPPENREPRPEEIVSCLPYLQTQLEILSPDIIVALGAHAARTLLDTNKAIGLLRGQFHDYYPGIGKPAIKVMVTYHPAYLLRSYSPDNRRRVWEDMKKVLAYLDLPIPETKQN
jgi:DNA polymerase